MLKVVLYEILGDYPKTYRLTQLFTDLVKLINNKCCVEDFYKLNRDSLLMLEYSYVASRYMASSFSNDDAEKALKLAEEFGKVIKCVRS